MSLKRSFKVCLICTFPFRSLYDLLSENNLDFSLLPLCGKETKTNSVFTMEIATSGRNASVKEWPLLNFCSCRKVN